MQSNEGINKELKFAQYITFAFIKLCLTLFIVLKTLITDQMYIKGEVFLLQLSATFNWI